MPERAPTTVYIVPHTHWDREWYATFETFRAQLVELWDQLLALTEEDPDFRFLMDGQTVVIDDYLEVRPQAKERLEGAIRRGQIQVGPWYTLPDEFLVSGETLLRDLQRGIAAAEAHGGSMRVGYLPDSFGHAAQMPQLYHQLGFHYAAVWRGVPLEIDRVAFSWEAPDGSRILTAYMGNSYAQGVDLPTDPAALATRVASALEAIEPFRPTANVLLMNGNDHVLPQASLSEAIRGASGRLNGTIIRLARLDDYLATLPSEGWPQWQGELRSSARANVLMGTLSVRIPDKQRHFAASRTLERLAEPIAALTGIEAEDALQQAWTLMLQNAAHDTACGSGIDAVAEASRQRSISALHIAAAVVERGLTRLAGAGQVWNPSLFPRQGLVEVDGSLVLTPEIAGGSVGSLIPASPQVAVTADSRRLENVRLSCELLPDGTLTILDRQTGVRYQGLHRLVDEGDAGDEYNFSPPALNPQPPDPVRNFGSTVAETGPLRARLEARFDFAVYEGLGPDRAARSDRETILPIHLTLSLEADTARLDVEMEIINRTPDHRLRVHFPLPFQVSESAADTPFHVTRRPVIGPRRDPGAAEIELPTYPMWSFVDVSDGRAGLALIADGLHEYEVLPGNPQELALTLLRSVGWLSRDDLTTRTGHAGPEMETPGAQVMGGHRLRYSLYFHEGDWERGAVWRMAESTLTPLVPGRGPTVTTPVPRIELSPDSIQMTALLPRRQGYDLRLLNASDAPHEATIELQPQPAEASAVTLAGDPLAPLAVGDGAVRLSLPAWGIATLRVRT
ncbi:MAG TPA: glycoside hydrolase family 38 C-terminal domain-containing protein [Candidatus Dormibacteraeota bacterium]|nr:glycoside hydrolase family 38 C-terminal domain-containing protein [Candidatus Dormibacteraeota bacterium]